MIVTVSLIRGFKQEISEKVYGFWGHISITDIRADNSYEAMPIQRDTIMIGSLLDIGSVSVDYGQVGKWPIESKAGVAHVQSVAHIPAIVTAEGEMEGVVIKGVGKDFDWSIMERFIVHGETLDLTSEDAGSGLLVSEYTADRLGLESGQRIVVHILKNDRQVQRRFTISGIYRTGLEDYDKKFALASLPTVQGLLGWGSNQIGAYEVFVENVDDAQVINDYIYLEELPSKLYSQTIRSRFPNIFEWLELQDVNQMVILGLTLVVAVINMISVLLILILERTRMIGIFKALGSSNWKIQEIFLYHAASIILRGMLIGNLLGLALCFLQDRFKLITLNEADYYLSYAPVDLAPLPILAINAASILIIMIFLLVPTILITRIDPVRTIQFR